MKFLYLLLFISLIYSCNIGNNKEKKRQLDYTLSKAQQDSIFKLADSISNTDHPEFAMDYVDLLVKSDSKNGKWVTLHGRVYGLSGDLDQSRADFRKAIDLNYRKWNAYYSMGLIDMFSNKNKSAILLFDSALMENANDTLARTLRDSLMKL